MLHVGKLFSLRCSFFEQTRICLSSQTILEAPSAPVPSRSGSDSDQTAEKKRHLGINNRRGFGCGGTSSSVIIPPLWIHKGKLHQHALAASPEGPAPALCCPSEAIKTVSARCSSVNEHTHRWPSGFGPGHNSLSVLFLSVCSRCGRRFRQTLFIAASK